MRNMASRQRGVAILTVLVIAALVMTLATVIMVRQARAIRQTENYESLERAWQYALALEQFVGVNLKREALSHPGYDAIPDNMQIPPLPIQEGQGVVVGNFTGKVEDLQARFNINNVLDENGKARNDGGIETLKSLVILNQLPESYADALIDWIDPDTVIRSGDSAESDYYLSGSIPYRAANQPFTDISELRLVRLEIPDPKKKERYLQRFLSTVTVLPTFTKININTANPSVLEALGLTPEQIKTITEAHKSNKPFKTMAEFWTAMAFSAEQTKDQQRLANLLDIHSNYYRIQGEIRLDRARVLLTSVLFSEPGKPVRVIMRQFDKVNEQQNSNNHVSATSPNS